MSTLLDSTDGGAALLPDAAGYALAAAAPLVTASAPDTGGAPAATASAPAVDLQGFQIGAHRFLVNYLDAVELESVGHLTRVPAAPAWIAGLVNLHGSVVAVFDLHGLLGSAQGVAAVPAAALATASATAAAGSPAAEPMLLVLRHRRDRIALLIDGMTRRLRFDPAAAVGGDSAAPLYGAHIVRAFDDGAHDGADGTAALWHELDFVALIDGLHAAENSLEKEIT